LKSGKVVGLADHAILISKNGTERHIGDSGAPIKNPKGEIIGVVLVFRDITLESKLQEDMARTERLESIGSLAGGIAHDFNNILTAIEGNIAIAKLHSGSESRILEYLDNAEKASNRAEDLTERLLTFAEGGDPVKKPTDLRKMLTETVRFALSGSKVTYSISAGENLWSVELDEGQMSQVIANIVTNAKDAMPGGGVVEMRAENETRVEDGQPGRPAGKYVRIEIKDRGTGIPKENLQRIFEPFFTTKPDGKGLGLAVAYSIVKKHDGWIDADSEVERGSTFRVFLPALESVPEHRCPAEAECTGGSGRILWMDDEELIREVGGEMLDHLGYSAESAEHGEKALEMFAAALRTKKPYDAVILDLTIPGGMGGKETMAKLRDIDPKVKAVVCSGYSNDPVMANHKEHGFEGVLPKPFKMAELGDVLARILNGGNDTAQPSNGDRTLPRSSSEEHTSEPSKPAPA
jgi:signal transduction histidine kinase/CheY-like chemotaxis protein